MRSGRSSSSSSKVSSRVSRTVLTALVIGVTSGEGSGRPARTASSTARRVVTKSGAATLEPAGPDIVSCGSARAIAARSRGDLGAWLTTVHEPQGIDAVLEHVTQHLGEAVQPARGGRADDDGRAGPREHRRARSRCGPRPRTSRTRGGRRCRVDVSDHDRVGREQRVEGCVEGSWPERRPAPAPAHPEEQVVAAFLDVEHHRVDGRRAERPAAMRFDQLGEARDDVGRVVEHALVGVEREIGEQHGSRTTSGREALRDRGRDRGRARSPRTGHGDEVTGPRPNRGWRWALLRRRRGGSPSSCRRAR